MSAIAAARAEVDALVAELAGLEALAERHQRAAGEAARAHRAGKASADELQTATSGAAAIDFALTQTRADLEAARAKVLEMESAAADEVLLAEIAAGTIEYRHAEAEQWDLLDATEQAIARAIVKSKELTQAASIAKGRASKAAHALAERHGTPPQQGRPPVLEYQRAVNGTDVQPLTGQEQVTRWPAGHAHRLLKDLPNSLMGVTIRPVDGA